MASISSAASVPWPVALARETSAIVAAGAEEQERTGQLAPEALGALKSANLFGLMTPAELGGHEAKQTEILEVFAEVSRAEGAVGWVLTTCAFATGLAGVFMNDSAVDVVFGKGMPIIAGAGAPGGRAVAVDGGFRFSGRWSYGSGIRHATHTHNGGLILDAGGAVRKDLGHHIFVAPIEATALDTEWDVLGLRGTGSVDYSIDDVFLATGYEHPTVAPIQRRGGPMYRVGMAGLSALAHTGFFLGIGRRVLDELASVARSKRGVGSGTLSESETFLDGFGLAEAKYRAAKALVFETWSEIERLTDAGQPIGQTLIAETQLAMCHMAWASTEAAEFAYKAGGGAALRSGPLQRAFRDTLAGRQHVRVGAHVLRGAATALLQPPLA
ncbi:MAG: hypothetical protein AB7N24_17225 [Dehalococcoidia bacterium]